MDIGFISEAHDLKNDIIEYDREIKEFEQNNFLPY